MQELKSLVLNNFSSVFEIFCAYYLVLGISKFFRDYFDISIWFKDWINNDFLTTDKLTLIEKDIQDESLNLGAITTEKLNNSKYLVMVIFHSCIHFLKKRRAKKRGKYRKHLIQKVQKLKRRIEFHYPKEINSSTQQILDFNSVEARKIATQNPSYFSLIRPIYLYFGILSMCLLFLSGYYSEWQKEESLSLLNIMSGCIIIFFILQLIIVHYKLKPLIQITPIKAFVYSILILLTALLLPNYYIDSISFCKLPQSSANQFRVNMNDIVNFKFYNHAKKIYGKPDSVCA